MPASVERFDIAPLIERDGYAIVEGVLDPDYCVRAKAELAAAIDREAEYHGSRDYGDYGMVLLCALYGGAFVELLDNERLLAGFEDVLGPGCIVYAYTSSSMPPRKANYSRRIHVDSPRLIPGYVTNMGATILIDDFTEENGATTFLPGSHTRAEAPSPEEYEAGCSGSSPRPAASSSSTHACGTRGPTTRPPSGATHSRSMCAGHS